MLKISQEELVRLYEMESLNPYQIAELHGCNHKTIRSHLKMHGVAARKPSEYNYLPRRTHLNPTMDSLLSKSSIMAHTAYWCEGWHTKKTEYLNYCNTNPKLIKVFIDCLVNIYKVKQISVSLVLTCKSDLSFFIEKYPKAKYNVDPRKKCPLIEVTAGGKNLSALFISNAKMILRSLTEI